MEMKSWVRLIIFLGLTLGVITEGSSATISISCGAFGQELSVRQAGAGVGGQSRRRLSVEYCHLFTDEGRGCFASFKLRALPV